MPIELKADTSHYDKCRMLMLKHKNYHKTRLIIMGITLLLNSYLNITLPIRYGKSLFVGSTIYGFAFGIVAFLYCVGILILKLFAVPEKPKLLILDGLLIILGMISDLVNPALGILLLIVCITEIPECKQAVWIQNQAGYPYFNERFDEQMEKFGKEYQPDHELDHISQAEMLDILEEGSPDFIVKPKTEIPEIPDISE